MLSQKLIHFCFMSSNFIAKYNTRLIYLEAKTCAGGMKFVNNADKCAMLQCPAE